jgi:ribonuclease Z
VIRAAILLTMLALAQAAAAAPCLVVALTGTQGGPPPHDGLAGAGTLVRYGDDADNCSAVRLQFDAGRGTTMRLSQLGVVPAQVHALFITHIHSDHVDGVADLAQLRWHFASPGPKLDLVCSADVPAPQGHPASCRALAASIGEAYLRSGEIAQRRVEDANRLPGGPADVLNVITFQPENEPKNVWSRGDVRVSAIRSTHIAGHASYRVDTPAGSVVIGGDAGNDVPAPPRSSSTSEQVERLAKGAAIVVHSAIHPVMGPDKGSGMPPPIYHRQSSAADLGAMAQRAGARILMLTHLIPPLGAERQGPWKIPGGALREADYRKAAEESGFRGEVVVGKDLVSVRLPAN